MIATTTVIHLMAQAAGAPSTGEAILGMLTPFILIFFVFYFLMWRPQAKRQQEHSSFLNALKSGDEIVTKGGIVGTVRSIDGKLVSIEVSKGTKIKVLKSQIAGSRESLVGKEESDS